MSAIFTDRLILIPCSLDIAKALIFQRGRLSIRAPIEIPPEWPTPDLKGSLPLYIENLEKDPTELGWGIWIMIEYFDKKIIGDIGFRGKPDENNCVEIGYSVVNDYRKQGYGFEAVQTLVDWAFTKGAKTVYSECHKGNAASIRILEKVGMCCIKKEDHFLTWNIQKE